MFKMLNKTEIIYIFDIDGCILPSIFPNLSKKVSIELIRNKIKTISIYKSFIEYYKLISNSPEIKKIFLTGRKAKDFRNETIDQLKPLGIKENQIVFYPNTYSHSKIRYFTFKIYNILKIAFSNRKHSEIIVFDDICDYFKRLSERASIMNIITLKLNCVKEPKDYWLKRVLKLIIIKKSWNNV